MIIENEISYTNNHGGTVRSNCDTNQGGLSSSVTRPVFRRSGGAARRANCCACLTPPVLRGIDDVARVPRRRLARYTGPAAVSVTLGGILAATVLSPTFSWQASALSDLGVAPGTAWLFNGALVVGGVVGAPYAWALWSAAADPLSRLRAATYLLALISMAGVGLLPAGRPLHYPLALAFFVLAALTAIVDGVARLRLNAGKLALLSGLLAPTAWPAWMLWLDGGGVAVPEFVGAALFGIWVVWLSPERPGSPL